MKLVAFDDGAQRRHGTMTDDGYIEADTGESPVALDDVTLLPPCDPGKIVGAARNYYADAAERAEGESPDRPLIFFKPSSSVIPAGGTVRIPDSSAIICEAELGVVIDGPCRNVDRAEALDYVRGYTCVDDVTAIDWGSRENYGVRTKGMDTFCPTGPVIETETGDGEPERDVTLAVNGETIAESNTDLMIFGVAELISHISQFMTLETDDIVATGAPPQNTTLEPQDTVSIDIEGVGRLEHDVAE